MEQQQLDPLINAAVLAGDDVVHQMRMQQQQQPPSINGAGQLHQQPEAVAPLPPLQHHHQVVPQAAAPATAPPLLHNVVHTTMYPPAALGGGGGGGSGGQPLQSHPTLPQLPQQQQQQQQVAVAVAPPRNKADHTNYNSSSSNSNTLTLNHPQNESYKLKTNQYLLETSSRLDDAVSELSHYSSLLSHANNQQQSSSSSKSSKSSSSAASSSTNTIECITNIEESIIPLLKLCSTAMKDAGKYFAPFSGTTNIHNRNDAERKRKLVLEEEDRVQREYEQERMNSSVGVGGSGGKKKKRKRGKKKRPALLMINDFVERNKLTDTRNFDLDDDYATNSMATAAAAAGVGGTESSEQQEVDVLPSPQFPPTTSSTTRKRKSLSTSNKKSTTKNKPSTKASTTTTESIIILRPQNGTTYTKSEAIAICKKYRKNSRERGLAIRAMIHKKYVLASRKTLYRLLQQDEEGKVLYESGWLGCGRPLKVDLTSGSGSGGGVNKGLLLVNDKLTFEDLDRGEENRILVRVNGKDDGEEEEDNDGGENAAANNEEEKEEGEGLSEGNDDDNNNNDDKHPSKKKRKKGKTLSIPPPPAKQKSCSAPGCANQVARRGLCVKHGMEHVDSKVRKFKLPLPRDGGTVYKKSECVEIAKQYKKGTSERRLALEAMIYRGYAKNSLKSLYRLLLNDEKGIPIVDDDWRGLGCPSVLSATEIDEVVERIKREDIRLSSDEDVRQLVVDALRDKGVTDESKLKFSATTVKNYGAIFKSKLSTVYWKNTGVDEYQQQQQQGFV